MAELVVESELATGSLVKPFDISYPGKLSYWALATSAGSADDPVALFWSWLTREASRYVREKQINRQSRPIADKLLDSNVS